MLGVCMQCRRFFVAQQWFTRSNQKRAKISVDASHVNFGDKRWCPGQRDDVTSLQDKHAAYIHGFLVGEVRLKHGYDFAIHSNIEPWMVMVTEVNLCVDVVASPDGHNQLSVVVFHTTQKMAIRRAQRPILNHYCAVIGPDSKIGTFDVSRWFVWILQRTLAWFPFSIFSSNIFIRSVFTLKWTFEYVSYAIYFKNWKRSSSRHYWSVWHHYRLGQAHISHQFYLYASMNIEDYRIVRRGTNCLWTSKEEITFTKKCFLPLTSEAVYYPTFFLSKTSNDDSANVF